MPNHYHLCVTIYFWSDEILEEMHQSWQQVVEEESEADPDFRGVYASYAALRKDYTIWRNHGYLK